MTRDDSATATAAFGQVTARPGGADPRPGRRRAALELPAAASRGCDRHGLRSRCALALLATVLPATAGAVTGPTAENPESTVRLISPWAAAPAEGELWLGLAFTTAPGWHVYWKNSGDAGYPPVVSFAATPEIAAAELLYPAPERYELPGGLVAFGYEKEVVYPVRTRLSAPGRDWIEVAADLDYLVCEVDCIPYSVRLTLEQPLAGPDRPAAEDPASAPLLAAWRDRLPAPPEALGLTTRSALDLAVPERPALEIAVDGAAAAGAAAPELFLEVHELFTAGAPVAERTGAGLVFRVPLEWRELPATLPESAELAWTVTGLAVDGGGAAGGAIEARQAVPATTGPGPAPALPSGEPARAALASAAWALGAVAALLAALACWGIFGPRAGRDLPAAGSGGDPRRRSALGFAALAAAVGFVYRLALDLPADALAAVELALLALALAAWARGRAGRPVLRAAMLVAMLLAAAAAVGLAARAAPGAAVEPPAGRIAAGR